MKEQIRSKKFEKSRTWQEISRGMGGRIEMIRVKDRGLQLTTRKSRKKLDRHTDKHPVMPGLCSKEILEHVDFENVVTHKKIYVNVKEDARTPLRNLEDRKLVKTGKQ